MKRHIADDKGKIVRFDESKPVCGTNFCDHCGDCLACYGRTACRESKNGHRWVVYLGEGQSVLTEEILLEEPS